MHASVPRVLCRDHGVLLIETGWAEQRLSVTQSMESYAIDVLLETQTVSGASRLLGLSWDVMSGIINSVPLSQPDSPV